MKANELMIGDWVSLGDNSQNAQVIGMATSSVITTSEDGDILQYSDLLPIPLTEDILKANGFECKGQHLYILHYRPYEIDIRLGNNYSEITIAELVYNPEDVTETNWQSDMEFAHSLSAHELQHALRLCGLNELADNFKIE